MDTVDETRRGTTRTTLPVDRSQTTARPSTSTAAISFVPTKEISPSGRGFTGERGGEGGGGGGESDRLFFPDSVS
jgi:hypothetical protein